ncbi:MAG: hypothetical protein IJ106_12990 [Parasporobacterium sp.]|nr:hypothetical protein [Parasporobacterium sp.]
MSKYYCQGDVIRISDYKDTFLIISKNAFIKASGVFHVCPLIPGIAEGPLHISVNGNHGASGTAICEQIKLIDPAQRNCKKVDYISYAQLMNVSDAVQGIFEYD